MQNPARQAKLDKDIQLACHQRQQTNKKTITKQMQDAHLVWKPLKWSEKIHAHACNMSTLHKRIMHWKTGNVERDEAQDKWRDRWREVTPSTQRNQIPSIMCGSGPGDTDANNNEDDGSWWWRNQKSLSYL